MVALSGGHRRGHRRGRGHRRRHRRGHQRGHRRGHQRGQLGHFLDVPRKSEKKRGLASQCTKCLRRYPRWCPRRIVFLYLFLCKMLMKIHFAQVSTSMSSASSSFLSTIFYQPGDLNMQMRFLQLDVLWFNIGVYHWPSLPRTKLRGALALRGLRDGSPKWPRPEGPWYLFLKLF